MGTLVCCRDMSKPEINTPQAPRNHALAKRESLE